MTRKHPKGPMRLFLAPIAGSDLSEKRDARREKSSVKSLIHNGFPFTSRSVNLPIKMALSHPQRKPEASSGALSSPNTPFESTSIRFGSAVSAGGQRKSRAPSSVVNIRPAGKDHQVVTVTGGGHTYRRTPCGGCPWVVANSGSFPPEAFAHSASTAYDMAENRFACHESGASKPATCAGFLLRGADHNLAVRLDKIRGLDYADVEEGARSLHASYRAMAVANGLPADHPALAACRGEDD